MAFRNLKNDFQTFNNIMSATSSGTSFKLSELPDFNIIWLPLENHNIKQEKGEFLKHKEEYKKYMDHLLTKYNVKHPKEGKRRLRLHIH